MKKSKFLQSSKDMLSRSFNPAKCKTSLRLAGSRLKLMRNKKEVQVKQMKREIAQLLESGQDRTARIRVEHVIREEKMMAAYDLLEIYCELIVSRLPIIESQKNIPIDLKEALASVIFASPRCGDVPELLDIRKHLTAKYGKEFTTAAIELRPACGVGRMLVEKLSAVAPDGQAKIKILSAIAEEHNVNWDPNSIDEKDSVPPNDLLTGPNNFVKASTMLAEPPRVEVPDVQASPSNNKMHGPLWNVSQLDHRTSLGTENLPSQNSGVSSIQPTARPLGDNRTQLSQEDSFTSSLDGHNWNMEFKDATSAAQAAAESAERASMAARAAAELSNRDRIMRQNSTESHNSNGRILKDGLETCGNSKLTSKQFTEDSANRSSLEDTRLQKDQIDRIKANDENVSGSFKESRGDEKKYVPAASLKSKASEDYELMNLDIPAVGAHSQNSSNVSRAESDNFREERIEKKPSARSSHGDTKKYVQSPSLKSKASRDYESVDHDVPAVDVNSQKNSSKVASGEIRIKEQGFNFEAENTDDWPEKYENFREERIRKQPSVKSYRSHSSVSDDVNIFADTEDQNSGYDAVGRGSIHGEALQTSYHEPTSAVFDKSDSDSDDHGLYLGPSVDETESKFHLRSQSPEQFSINTDSWSHISSSSKMMKPNSPTLFSSRKNSSPDLSENLISKDGTGSDNFIPVKFDDSDGPSSESDEEMIMPSHTLMEEPKDILNKQSESGELDGLEFKEKEYSGINTEQSSLSSDDEWKSTQFLRERNRGKSGSPEKLSLGKSSADLPASRPNEFQIESNEFENKVSPDTGDGLNFGKLTGGFRHKGFTRPPFLKNRLSRSSSSKKETEEITASTSPPTESPKISTMSSHKKSTGSPHLHLDTDSDSSEEEESLPKSSGHRQTRFTSSAGEQVRIETGLKLRNSVFGSDNSDLDESVPKESHTKKNHLRSGVSRRTKTSSSSKPSSHIRTRHEEFEALDSDVTIERESKISVIFETPRDSESRMKNSTQWENYERPTSAKMASMQTKSSLWASPEMHESKTGLKPGALDPDAKNERKPVYSKRKESKVLDSVGTEERKSSTSNITEAPREFESKMKNSKEDENYERPTSATEACKPAKSSFWAPPEKPKLASESSYSSKLETPEQPTSEKSASIGAPVSRISYKSSASEPPSSPQTKTEASVSSENPKAATSNKTQSNDTGSPRKAGHVHPKLPDYDNLVQALRKNRP